MKSPRPVESTTQVLGPWAAACRALNTAVRATARRRSQVVVRMGLGRRLPRGSAKDGHPLAVGCGEAAGCGRVEMEALEVETCARRHVARDRQREPAARPDRTDGHESGRIEQQLQRAERALGAEGARPDEA